MVEHWRGKGYLGTAVWYDHEKWLIVEHNVKTKTIVLLRMRDLATTLCIRNPYFLQWEK